MKKALFKNKHLREEGAFTFIELLVSLIVLSVGVLSVIAVSSKSYTAISLQRNKLIATNLVREGFETVRYIRNKNWLSAGPSNCDGGTTTLVCSDNQTLENGGDCDWRCGDEEDDTTNYQPTFKLGAPVGSDYLVDRYYDDREGQEKWAKRTEKAALPNPDNKEEIEGRCRAMIGEEDSDPINDPAIDVYHYPFARFINITRDQDLNGDTILGNDLLVQVIVCWKERGKFNSVSGEEQLYNWKGK